MTNIISYGRRHAARTPESTVIYRHHDMMHGAPKKLHFASLLLQFPPRHGHSSTCIAEWRDSSFCSLTPAEVNI